MLNNTLRLRTNKERFILNHLNFIFILHAEPEYLYLGTDGITGYHFKYFYVVLYMDWMTAVTHAAAHGGAIIR